MYRTSKNQEGVPHNHCRYYFDARIDGKRCRQTVVCRKSMVEKTYHNWYEDERLKIEKGTPCMLFENFQRYLNEHVLNEKTAGQYHAELTFYQKRVTTFFSDMDLRDMKRHHIESYITWRSTHPWHCNKVRVSKSTVKKDINILSAFFSWCIKHEMYDKRNPCFKMGFKENNERHINLTVSQIQEIIHCSQAYGELEQAVMLALFCGLRRGEILSLRWSDIDFENQRIHLRSENTKSKRSRSIPIPDRLFESLQQMDRTSERVLTIKQDALRYKFRRMRSTLSFRDALHVEELHFHDLRHVYAQTLRNMGVSLDDIQSFLGHSSVRVTEQRYAQTGGINGVEKVNILNQIIPEEGTRGPIGDVVKIRSNYH